MRQERFRSRVKTSTQAYRELVTAQFSEPQARALVEILQSAGIVEPGATNLLATPLLPMRSIKLYAGIDYQFRPESYWGPAGNPLEAAIRNVKGRNRRAMIRDYHEAGDLEQLDENLLADTLEDEARVSLGQIHPSFMGGEYLPNYQRSEVEIARIEPESTTSDVISLRARSVGSRIKYRLVDEYETEFRLPQQTSARPFSLGELVRFLDSVERVDNTEPSWAQFGFVLLYSQWNLECGADLETLRNFVRVESDYYPDLASHYTKAIEEWYEVRLAEVSIEE